MTHAFFKALLFLGAGSVIHGVEHGHHHVAHKAHEPDAHAAQGSGDAHGDAHPAEEEFDPQDMRNMGGLWKRMRTTSIVYLIGALALMGIFPLAGFGANRRHHRIVIDLVLLIVGDVDGVLHDAAAIMIFFAATRPPRMQAPRCCR
jgi:NADH:ubiquinone oxidoreductase subunit 5 (subunit L)/multisubunit Na+/H+ antiporter MnhA subunit